MSDPGGNVVSFPRNSRFTFEPFADIEPSRASWRVKGLIPATGVCFIVGASKAGKSFIALDLTLRLAAGAASVFGKKAKPCAVVYIGAEDPSGCRTRIAAWRRTNPRGAYTPFEFVGQRPDLLSADEMADLRASLDLKAADLKADGHDLGIVVFDTFSRCIPGADENGSADMSKASDALAELAEALGVLVVVVAHHGKGGSEKGIRGWSGLGANADSSIIVERDGEDPDLRLITFDKVKNGRDGHRLAFRLEEAETGLLDEDGEAIKSCVPAYEVAPGSGAKAARKRPLSSSQAVVLASIKHVTDHAQTYPPPKTALGVKPWHKAVTVDDVRERAKANGLSNEGEQRNTTNVRFSRALEALVGRQQVRQEGGLIWLP